MEDSNWRVYVEDRLLERAIEEGWIRRPIGFLDPSTLKEKLYEQFIGDPLAGDVPKGWETE